tara:strand:- start:487 stop:1293 length:807 start_codon:yes stop_codon:yes gene_type:complete
VSDVDVNIFDIRPWMIQPTIIQDRYAPITLELGFPVVDMPGCVEMHKDNVDKTLPFDKDLVNQDPKGSITLCPHGEYPSFNSINYEPEQVIITKEAEVPNIVPPPLKKKKKTEDNDNNNEENNDEGGDEGAINRLDAPNTGNLGLEDEVSCPGPLQLRIGDVTQSGDERVVGHRLLDDGVTCETLYEPTTVLEKYVPPMNQITSVTTLAVVATAGAATTPVLIKVIKPIVKKIWAAVQKKLGKRKKKDKLTSDQILKKNGMKKLKIPD